MCAGNYAHAAKRAVSLTGRGMHLSLTSLCVRANDTGNGVEVLEGWLSVKKAAKYADVSERTMREWLKDGLHCSRRTRKTIRIKCSDIDAYLERYMVSESKIDDVIDELLKDF